ncbi:MAG: hypothetical protein QG555_750, partial [Thermodesulfobacteriota bacterium]|nr:hypothetical protein [Thermodesulfobacteriota bacterium]
EAYTPGMGDILAVKDDKIRHLLQFLKCLQ